MDADLIFNARFKGRQPPPPSSPAGRNKPACPAYLKVFFFFCLDGAGYLVSMRGCGGPFPIFDPMLVQRSYHLLLLYTFLPFCLAIVE